MKSKLKYVEESGENPLLKRDDLYNAALDTFSRTPFHDAQINAILRDAKMNKGSFYYRFNDKLDLYLCMLERAGKDKTAYLSKKLAAKKLTYNFFEQLHTIVLGTLEYARHDSRFYSFWRIYLSEGEDLKKQVREAFPEFAHDFLGEMIDAAIHAGQITCKYDRDFVDFVIQIYFTNIDTLVNSTMTDDEILTKVDQVVEFLKDSLAAK